MAFPMDIFWQALEGNWVAWFAIFVTIGFFAIILAFGILWWKLPEFAKKAFINNLRGHSPVVASCYEDKHVRFNLPTLFRSGLAFVKGAWYLFPKLWTPSVSGLTASEKAVLNNVYTIDGANAGFYVNYSIQAEVTNPQLLAMVQYYQTLKKMRGTKDNPIAIPKELFMSALEHLDEKEVWLQPMFIEFPLDLRYNVFEKGISNSEMLEHENRVKQSMRDNQDLAGGAGLGGAKLAALLAGVSVLLSVLILLKVFGVF